MPRRPLNVAKRPTNSDMQWPITVSARFTEMDLVVQKDLGAAKKWYEKAAQRGDGPAMLQLGDMYQDGDGVKADKVTAYSWMLLASIRRAPNAEKETELLKREMSEKEIGKAKEKAADFLRSWPSARTHIGCPAAPLRLPRGHSRSTASYQVSSEKIGDTGSVRRLSGCRIKLIRRLYYGAVEPWLRPYSRTSGSMSF